MKSLPAWFMNGKTFGPLGPLYTGNSWSDLSQWTPNGATPSIVSNKLVFSGGTGTYNKTLDLSSYGYTCLENWSITAQVQVGSKDGTSFGFGVGVRSYNSVNFQYDAFGQFLMYTGTGSGQCYSGASTNLTASASALTFSVGDIIEIIVSRSGLILTCSCRNVTTSSSTITSTTNYVISSSTNPVIPNTGRFAIYSIGGTFTVNSLVVSSTQFYGYKYLFNGDSKAEGYCSGSYAARYANIVGSNYGIGFNVHAGPGDSSAEMLLCIPEIIKLRPQVVIMGGISNDIRKLISAGVWQSNYASIVSQLNSAGIRVIHTTGFKEGVDQSAFQTWINSTYSSSNIIDTLPTVLSLNVDGIHPDSTGHSTIAGLLTSSGKL